MTALGAPVAQASSHAGRNTSSMIRINRPFAQLTSAQAMGAGDLEFDSRADEISTVLPTARNRCDVSWELCS